MAVELRKAGLHLTGTPLWLDARRKTELSFVSHAHADHIARHERLFATAPTVRFLEHRLKRLGGALTVPFNRPFELGSLHLELLPAGHVLGSAQLRVIRPDGLRITYTGDLNLEPSLTAEPAQVAECDVLVLESTFGHPRYVFPPRQRVLDELERWLKEKLGRGIAPILIGYPLGKSQEIICQLAARGFELCAHPAIWDIARLYGELGVEVKARRFEGQLKDGEVGVFPPFGRSAALRRLGPRASAVLTGWAVDGVGARRFGADVAFAFSDHADFPSLLRYAKACGAHEVITHHGFADELAEALGAQGVFARPAHRAVQLELGL